MKLNPFCIAKFQLNILVNHELFVSVGIVNFMGILKIYTAIRAKKYSPKSQVKPIVVAFNNNAGIKKLTNSPIKTGITYDQAAINATATVPINNECPLLQTKTTDMQDLKDLMRHLMSQLNMLQLISILITRSNDQTK